MTVRVVERKSFDRVGATGLASPGFTRWAVEQDDGDVVRTEWFDSKLEADEALRKLRATADPSWQLTRSRADWRL